MMENSLGYCGYLVDDLMRSKEVANDTPLSMSKFAFEAYVLSFPEGKEAVKNKGVVRENKLHSYSSVSSLLIGRNLSPGALKSKVKRSLN
jgi:hypothetical protein